MLRITVIESAASSQTLKLEGRVAGTLVDEVRRLCRELLASNQVPLILDVSDVSFIDSDGIALIRELGRRNVRVTKYSPFLAELLKEVVPCS
jgi:anti-anti-sigma factor